MFIQDQSRKVLFNMKFYTLKNMGSIIQIFDSGGTFVGEIGEYENPQLAEMLVEEAREIMQIAAMNRSYCIYEFPTNEEIRQVMENG